MAKQTVRIGSLPKVFMYDDTIHDTAIETDQPIAIGTPIASNHAATLAELDNLVTGPASVVDGNIAEFNGTTGKLIKDSGISHAQLAAAVAHSHSGVTQSITVVTDVGPPVVTSTLNFTDGILTSVT